jgi:hypothetical protein
MSAPDYPNHAAGFELADAVMSNPRRQIDIAHIKCQMDSSESAVDSFVSAVGLSRIQWVVVALLVERHSLIARVVMREAC